MGRESVALKHRLRPVVYEHSQAVWLSDQHDRARQLAEAYRREQSLKRRVVR
jgi:hypothetical protein